MTLVDIEMQTGNERATIVMRGLTVREAKRALRTAAKEAGATFDPETNVTRKNGYVLRIK